MPARPIIDAHHHLWDQLGTPRRSSLVARLFGWSPRALRWVMRTLFPRDLVAFFGDGASLDAVRDYLPPDLRADASGYALAGTVHVQAGWEGKGPLGPVGETRWLDQLPDGPAGIVGHADLTLGRDVEPVLAAHVEASAKFRGIRHMLAHHDARIVHSFAPRPGLAEEPGFRAGVERLARRGLSFDAWCYHHQLGEVARLARTFPELTVVLCHLGTPVAVGGPFGPLGHDARERHDTFLAWADALAEVAAEPNVVAKISGLTMPVLGWGYHLGESPPTAARVAEDLRPLVTHALEVFGPERCMFASNFPVDRVSLPYATLYGAYERLVADRTEAEQRRLFQGTAAQIYRLARPDA